ncbi:MAG: plasma-membrane proton-efflux P-type ATPase [Euryarchaeota archaeon]|nr:plasma-membrane proton-efflux P-type ATPase [Euryarchaeota archaeon]
MQESAQDLEKKSIDDVFKQFSSNEKGLNDKEVKERNEKYGFNEITEKKVSPLRKFLGYFWGPIPIMIIIAVILSAIIGHWEDFFIILALLFANAIVGFYQENKATDAIDLLKKRLAPEAKVLRNGNWTTLPSRELVPGDVVRIRLGDVVPADIKLFEGDYLEVDQSALTGESLPVDKKSGDVGFSGSTVRKGEMNGLVFATGLDTFFGKTAKLVGEAKTTSHFQRNVVKIGDYLIVLDIILVSLVFIMAILRHQSLLETLQFALVLTIAAIPVALPAVLSVTMAVGAIALAKKEAIVSRLIAIEEMAGMDILCSDKTGTITQNQLSVAKVITYEDSSDVEVLTEAALASRTEDEDPIDNAIIKGAEDTKGVKEEVENYQVKSFTPFDPVIKHTEAILDGKEGEIKVAKGAPQVILEMSANKDILSDQLRKDVHDLASAGYRALAVARSKNEEWHLTGLIGLHDPPREDSKKTINAAEKMGLNVKMVTGDHTDIAAEIAKEVDMSPNILPADSFTNISDDKAGEMVEKADGFAEVYPEHKYRIVSLLQDRGHIVGMTGDGVNDAPALKKADAGIAVEGSTDAAKSAADIVLTRPGLSVIIDAIVESRKIFQRMINYSVYRISETFRVLIFVTISILLFQFYPITALMIVLLALLNDLPILTIAFDNVKFSAKPEKWDMRTIILMGSYLGAMGVIQSLIVLYIGIEVFHLSISELQAYIYLVLSIGGHLVLLVARTKGPFWSVKPAPRLLWAIILTQLTATILVLFGILLPQLDPIYVAFVWGQGLLTFLIVDSTKVLLYNFLIKKGIVGEGIFEPEGISESSENITQTE